MEFISLKPGKAKIRCYVAGKDKTKYGDTITVNVTKNKGNYTLSKSGSSVKYEEAGDDFDLEVRKGSSIRASQLKWKISDKSILSFAGVRKTGTEVEFYAKKEGTAKVTCICTGGKAKGKKVVYTVKVVGTDYDDYDEYDD